MMDRSSAGLGDRCAEHIVANRGSGTESEEQNKQRRHQGSAANAGQAYNEAHAVAFPGSARCGACPQPPLRKRTLVPGQTIPPRASALRAYDDRQSSRGHGAEAQMAATTVEPWDGGRRPIRQGEGRPGGHAGTPQSALPRTSRSEDRGPFSRRSRAD
jgi:hypothetical protein